ncbi:hypothetical protein [Mycobacterium sp. 23]|uniref:hypothetical protein n=1 Tax=Mycobacterium sp. 23 TaxID=3400424 RepID=UPI003AAB4E86
MKLVGPGKEQVFDLAKEKLGDRFNAWLVTPRPEWHGLHDGTPRGLLESQCPTCVDEVLRAVEGMPDGD